jgi:tetratricopeptide (TPR) repeat protein
MFTEDYIMRMINQMVMVLASIIGLRKAGQYQEAHQLVNQSLEQLLGLDAGLIIQMDESSLLKVLTSQGELDKDRLYIIAELYEQEGYIYFDQEKLTSANSDFQRALLFYLEIALDEPSEDYPELPYKIRELDRRLETQALPVDMLFMLFDYYERGEEYGVVERVISRLLDQDDNQTEINQSVLAYYKGLLDKKDQDLLAGGVSRTQVKSRITSLESIQTR